MFQNRERLLPARPNGYYHEYTVKTPGLPDRGAVAACRRGARASCTTPTTITTASNRWSCHERQGGSAFFGGGRAGVLIAPVCALRRFFSHAQPSATAGGHFTWRTRSYRPLRSSSWNPAHGRWVSQATPGITGMRLKKSLNDMSWAPAWGYLLVFDGAGGFARSQPDEFAVALAILQESVRRWDALGIPLVVLLRGRAERLAMCPGCDEHVGQVANGPTSGFLRRCLR